MENKKSKDHVSNTNYEYTGDLPLGLGMALTHNIPAMKVFAALPDSERQEYIARAHSVTSRKEMNELVQTLIK